MRIVNPFTENSHIDLVEDRLIGDLKLQKGEKMRCLKLLVFGLLMCWFWSMTSIQGEAQDACSTACDECNTCLEACNYEPPAEQDYCRNQCNAGPCAECDACTGSGDPPGGDEPSGGSEPPSGGEEEEDKKTPAPLCPNFPGEVVPCPQDDSTNQPSPVPQPGDQLGSTPELPPGVEFICYERAVYSPPGSLRPIETESCSVNGNVRTCTHYVNGKTYREVCTQQGNTTTCQEVELDQNGNPTGIIRTAVTKCAQSGNVTACNAEHDQDGDGTTDVTVFESCTKSGSKTVCTKTYKHVVKTGPHPPSVLYCYLYGAHFVCSDHKVETTCVQQAIVKTCSQKVDNDGDGQWDYVGEEETFKEEVRNVCDVGSQIKSPTRDLFRPEMVPPDDLERPAVDTTTSPVQPQEPQQQCTEGEILVDQDFDRASLSGWSSGGRVSFINGTLNIGSGGYAHYPLNRDNMSLSVRVKFTRSGTLAIAYQDNGISSSYRLNLRSGSVELRREAPTGTTTLAGASASISSGTWFDLTLQAVEGQHRVLINGVVVLETTDSNPLPAGGITLETDGGLTGQFDDLIIREGILVCRDEEELDVRPLIHLSSLMEEEERGPCYKLKRKIVPGPASSAATPTQNVEEICEYVAGLRICNTSYDEDGDNVPDRYESLSCNISGTPTTCTKSYQDANGKTTEADTIVCTTVGSKRTCTGEKFSPPGTTPAKERWVETCEKLGPNKEKCTTTWDTNNDKTVGNSGDQYWEEVCEKTGNVENCTGNDGVHGSTGQSLATVVVKCTTVGQTTTCQIGQDMNGNDTFDGSPPDTLWETWTDDYQEQSCYPTVGEPADPDTSEGAPNVGPPPDYGDAPQDPRGQQPELEFDPWNLPLCYQILFEETGWTHVMDCRWIGNTKICRLEHRDPNGQVQYTQDSSCTYPPYTDEVCESVDSLGQKARKQCYVDSLGKRICTTGTDNDNDGKYDSPGDSYVEEQCEQIATLSIPPTYYEQCTTRSGNYGAQQSIAISSTWIRSCRLEGNRKICAEGEDTNQNGDLDQSEIGLNWTEAYQETVCVDPYSRTPGSSDPSSAQGGGYDELDVVVNELAWMGTLADPDDEWIELYNNTNRDIELNGWKLVSTFPDGSFEVALSGTIPANGYFLLEQGDDNTVSDIVADLIYYGQLYDEGMSLALIDANGKQIDTVNFDGGPWPGGILAGRLLTTMERVDPLLPDEDENWTMNDAITVNGIDALGNPINGTPKSKNSVISL